MQTDRSNASVLVGGALLIAGGLFSLAGQKTIRGARDESGPHPAHRCRRVSGAIPFQSVRLEEKWIG